MQMSKSPIISGYVFSESTAAFEIKHVMEYSMDNPLRSVSFVLTGQIYREYTQNKSNQIKKFYLKSVHFYNSTT